MMFQLPGEFRNWSKEHMMPSSDAFNYFLSIYLVPSTVLDTGDNSSE